MNADSFIEGLRLGQHGTPNLHKERELILNASICY